MEKVFLVHGYSVIKTTAYGWLHEKLAAAGYQPEDIYLGRYVTLDDTIEVRDIAKAMHLAILPRLAAMAAGDTFHIITHSTGALVVKHWLMEHYASRFDYPRRNLRNVIFTAGPHFGSRLAHHGRSVLNEVIKGGDPGRKVLNALELGSTYSWEIAEAFARDTSFWRDSGVRLYNIIGDHVRPGILDAIQLFREPGSDEVVRVAAGNLNFRHYRFAPADKKPFDPNFLDFGIQDIPFGILKPYVHSTGGVKNNVAIMMGIDHATPMPDMSVVDPLMWPRDSACFSLRVLLYLLAVKTDAQYRKAASDLALMNSAQPGITHFAQLQFRILDDKLQPIDDYYIAFGEEVKVGGKWDIQSSPAIAHLHKNTVSPENLTLFINTEMLNQNSPHGFKLRIVPQALYHYDPLPTSNTGDYSLVMGLNAADLKSVCIPNQTTLFELIFNRMPDGGLFRFDDSRAARGAQGKAHKYHVEWNRLGEIVDDDIPK